MAKISRPHYQTLESCPMQIKYPPPPWCIILIHIHIPINLFPSFEIWFFFLSHIVRYHVDPLSFLIYLPGCTCTLRGTSTGRNDWLSNSAYAWCTIRKYQKNTVMLQYIYIPGVPEKVGLEKTLWTKFPCWQIWMLHCLLFICIKSKNDFHLLVFKIGFEHELTCRTIFVIFCWVVDCSYTKTIQKVVKLVSRRSWCLKSGTKLSHQTNLRL